MSAPPVCPMPLASLSDEALTCLARAQHKLLCDRSLSAVRALTLAMAEATLSLGEVIALSVLVSRCDGEDARDLRARRVMAQAEAAVFVAKYVRPTALEAAEAEGW